MEYNLTDRFVDILRQMAETPLPEQVIRQAKMCMIDYMACAHLGARMLHEENQRYLSACAGEQGNSVLIGMGGRTGMHTAAMLNGMSSHVAELDDGHRYGMLHLSAPIISALLAIAGTHPISGTKLIKAMVVGFEAATRLASAIQPGHKLRGYHATGTCGTIGAAVAVSIAMDCSAAQLKAAVSAAATDAAGLLAAIDGTSTLKPYNVGRAAAAAIDAALTGQAGLVGPEDMLGGKRGFFQTMAAQVDEQYFTRRIEETYAIEQIYRKPYAACRHCHAAIEAAIRAFQESGSTAEDVQSVRIETYGLAVYGHEHTTIQGAASAKMSTPYSVAVGIACGKADYQQFEAPYLHDPGIAACAEKVTVTESPELSALVPAKRGAIASVQTRQGTFVCRVDYPKGEPENPITQDELEQKYYSLLRAAGCGDAYAAQLLGHIWHLESDFPALLELLPQGICG